MENTNNYGHVYHDGIRKSIPGCNQAIKSLNIQNTFIICVPKNYYEYFLTECQTNLEELLEFYKELKYEFEFVDAPEGYTQGNMGAEVFFKFNFKKELIFKHYYAFCLIRHLYFYNETFIKLFNIWKKDKGTAYKLIGLMPSYNIVPHTYFYNVEGADELFKSGKVYDGLLYTLEMINLDEYYLSSTPSDLWIAHPIKGKMYLHLKSKDYLYKNLDSAPFIASVLKKGNTIFTTYKTFEIMDRINIPEHFPTILSRHPSHNAFRKTFKLPGRVLIRLGSTTEKDMSKYKMEINSIKSITISSNKLLMKEAFSNSKVATAPWSTYRDNIFYVENTDEEMKELKFPIIAKNIYGSRGEGNYKLDDEAQLKAFLSKRKDLKNFIFEKYMPYAKEYRVHISTQGAFLIWRKLRRNDSGERWYFNNSNCNWVGEQHELFDTPSNMKEVIQECQKALNAVGLDIGGVDVRVQSNKNSSPKICVIEINSACSQAEKTSEAYIAEFKKIVNAKIQGKN